MINRTLALILFFMVSVVLYYENKQLKTEMQRLKSKVKQQTSQTITVVEKKAQPIDNHESNISQALLIVQEKLQICEENYKKQKILNMTPLEESKKQYINVNQTPKEMMRAQPYKKEMNQTKKNDIKLIPDVIYDRQKEDMGFQLKIEKQF